jgi:hypothetical protein
MGVALAPLHGTTAKELIKKVDVATLLGEESWSCSVDNS